MSALRRLPTAKIKIIFESIKNNSKNIKKIIQRKTLPHRATGAAEIKRFFMAAVFGYLSEY
jgi:hypothetical protein